MIEICSTNSWPIVIATSGGASAIRRASCEPSAALSQSAVKTVKLNWFHLGDVALHLGDYQQAKALIEKGLALRKEAGSKSGIAWSLQNLGYLAQH